MPKQEAQEKEAEESKKYETTRYVAGRVPFPRNPLKETIAVAQTIEKESAGDPFDPILLAKALGTILLTLLHAKGS